MYYPILLIQRLAPSIPLTQSHAFLNSLMSVMLLQPPENSLSGLMTGTGLTNLPVLNLDTVIVKILS